VNILAVDTSCQALVTALKTDKFYSESEDKVQGMQHSQLLMNKIIELCQKAGITTKEIDLLICTRGPGSFTGLRIGMATLKGISLGSAKPIVSVSTLETHAQTIRDFDGAVVPVIDAKKQRFYISAFECKNGTCTRLMDDTDGTEANLAGVAAKYNKILLTGPDAEIFLPKAQAAYPAVNFCLEVPEKKTFPQSLIELGLKEFSTKGADDIGQGPVYIRKSDAEIALEEKEKNL